MHERHLRLFLICVMVVSLFLPTAPDPMWLYILFYTFYEPFCPPFVLAVPILIFLNVCMLVSESTLMRSVYTVTLSLLFLAVCIGTLISDSSYWSVGFWARLGVVFAAGLVEVLVAKGWMVKASTAGQ